MVWCFYMGFILISLYISICKKKTWYLNCRELSNGSFNLMDDFLHSVNNLLDEIWRLPNNYPQNRMTDLMDIIC